MKKAKAKRKATRKPGARPQSHLTLLLPKEVIAFYEEVSSISGVGLNDVINVVLAIRAIKWVDAV